MTVREWLTDARENGGLPAYSIGLLATVAIELLIAMAAGVGAVEAWFYVFGRDSLHAAISVPAVDLALYLVVTGFIYRFGTYDTL